MPMKRNMKSETEKAENFYGEMFCLCLWLPSVCVVEFIRIWHSSEQPKCIRRNNLTIVRNMHATFECSSLVSLWHFSEKLRISLRRAKLQLWIAVLLFLFSFHRLVNTFALCVKMALKLTIYQGSNSQIQY